MSGGADDEYRAVVFDESFVRAARIQEFSARERLDTDGGPVRVRHTFPSGLARQATVLVLLIMAAFTFALYMGVRHPYRAHHTTPVPQLRAQVIALVPAGKVPAVSASRPFTGRSVVGYGTDAAGISLPDPHRVGGFAESEVAEALNTAKDYLVASSINPRTLFDGDVRGVLNLLDPGQADQFDTGLAEPALDGSREATGWLVRFKPDLPLAQVGQVRVKGSLTASETSDKQLQIATDHTFVYALHGLGAADTGVSLFTVRRELRFHFDHTDVRHHRLEVATADVAAGPLACSGSVGGYFRPILAGGTAGSVAPVDPFSRTRPVGAVCAPLSAKDMTGGPPVKKHTAGSAADKAGTVGTAGTSNTGGPTPGAGPAVTSTPPGTLPTGGVWHDAGASPAGPTSPAGPVGPVGRTAEATPRLPALLLSPSPRRPSPRSL